MTQNAREACRLTVAAGLEELKLERATEAANEWLADQDRRERERVKPQLEYDHLFAAVNQKTSSRRQAVDTPYEAVSAPEPYKVEKPVTGWGWFLMGLLVAGLGLLCRVCWIGVI